MDENREDEMETRIIRIDVHGTGLLSWVLAGAFKVTREYGGVCILGVQFRRPRIKRRVIWEK